MSSRKASKFLLDTGSFYEQYNATCHKCKKNWKYFSTDESQFYISEDNKLARSITFVDFAPRSITIWFCTCRKPLVSEFINEEKQEHHLFFDVW